MRTKEDKKLQDLANRFEKEFFHTNQGSYVKAIEPYAKYLPLLAALLENKTASGHLILGFSVSMEGIIEGESTLALFSQDLKRLTDLTVKGLFQTKAVLSEDESKISVDSQLYSRLMIAFFAALIGLINQANLANNEEKGESFFLQILLRTLFKSSMPYSTLRSLSLASGIGEKEADLAASSLECLGMLLVLIAFKKENKSYNHELLENMKERLTKHLFLLETTINDFILTGSADVEQLKPVRLFINQGKLTLEARSFDQFLKRIGETASFYNISLTKLEKDMMAAKDFFKSLTPNFEDTSQINDNEIMMIG